MQRAKIFLLTGHTASGKSTIIDELLKTNTNSIVLNIDSIQVYKENKILSAQPSFTDHRYFFYNFLNSQEPFNFKIMFDNIFSKVSEFLKQECNIYIIGGSPMYVRNILNGFYIIPEVDKTVLIDIEKEYNLDRHKIYKELINIDINYKTFIKENDIKRIIRYLSVYRSFGKKIEDFSKKKGLEDYSKINKILLYLDREILYSNANLRVDKMIKEGAIDEVEFFLKKYKGYNYKDFQIYKTIGFADVEDYFLNNINFQDMVENIKRRTRNYIKHQDTWFRNNFNDFNKIKDLKDLNY